MKFLLKIIKKLIISTFFLYGYNLIAVNFNLIIPINLYTILLMYFFGIPILVGLIVFKIFIL